MLGVGHGSPAVPLLDSRFLCQSSGIGHSFVRHVSRGVWLDRLHPGAAGCPPHVLGQQAILDWKEQTSGQSHLLLGGG